MNIFSLPIIEISVAIIISWGLFSIFCSMIHEALPGAYTDISYDVAEGAAEKDNFLFDTFFNETNKAYGNKIMYGPDFFLAEQESAEKNTYDKFKSYAVGKTLTNGNNFWEQIAKTNTNNFLTSKYY